MNKVSIIGFGRFGNLLYELLQKGFEVDVFDIDSNNETESVHFVSLEDVLKNDTIFLAVPIRAVSYTHLRAHETREDRGCRVGV